MTKDKSTRLAVVTPSLPLMAPSAEQLNVPFQMLLPVETDASRPWKIVMSRADLRHHMKLERLRAAAAVAASTKS